MKNINPFDPDLEPILYEQWFREKYASIMDGKPRRSEKVKPNDRKSIIATCDFETDPFDGVSTIRPFAVGFYDGVIYRHHWGLDCPFRFVEWVKGLEQRHTIYAHNGGRFDFMFLLDWIEPDIFCIGRRIVKAHIIGNKGIVHDLVDSASLMPVPLKDAALKLNFDYDNMSVRKRDKYRPEILEYLKQDCVGLYDTIQVGRSVVGPSLTMASAAMKKLNESMPHVGRSKRAVEMLSESEDEKFRVFYYGGRVQCFERGILPGLWKVYDITSSYPNVMRDYQHPISASFVIGNTLDERTDFAIIDATSDGMLPIRAMDGRLAFPNGRYKFHACGHEIRMGLKLGKLSIHHIYQSYRATERTSFAPFIDKYFALRMEAQAELKRAKEGGDRNKIAYWDAMQLFYKLVMNGAYGKFAINPRKFKDYMIHKMGSAVPDLPEGFMLSERFDKMDIYTKLSDPKTQWRSYLNVATGASITSAARAELLKGIANARRVIYCDTDSLVCEDFSGNIGGKLGQWKLETNAHLSAIVEKKTYALFGDVPDDMETYQKRMKDYQDASCVKLASKGVRLTAKQVLDAAQGQEVVYHPLAPTFRIDGSHVYTSRRIRMR